MIVPLAVAIALIGGRPASPGSVDRIDVAASLPFASIGGKSGGPRIDQESDGVRGFRFPAGTIAEIGYVVVPLPGDYLDEWGAARLEVEYRASGVSDSLDVVLVGADAVFRVPLDLSMAQWRVASYALAEFHDRSDPGRTMGRARPRFLRFEARERGLKEPATLDVRRVSFLRDGLPPPASRDARPTASPDGLGVSIVDGRIYRDGAPQFPFGIWLLGGNRALLAEAALHGISAQVEYGTVSWPRSAVEDHLDFARGCGVDVVVNLNDTLHGRDVNADERLSGVATRAGFFAWHLLDEPDGARLRGMDAARTSPARLAQRGRALPGPVFVNCLDSFGLSRYAEGAQILATDYYWPGYVRYPSPLLIASHAEAIHELASRRSAAPMIVLQLADPLWQEPARLQTPESLRAQVLASLSGGIRGIVVYEGVNAVRWADAGLPEGRIWSAFLELATDVSTWAPLVARWERTADLEWIPALGSVRAASFVEGDERWIVYVNLGTESADVSLGGTVLRGAAAIEDPRDGWRGLVRDGQWSGRLQSFEGRLVRVVGPEDAGTRATVAVSTIPAPGHEPLGFDQCIVGASIYPAPDAGSVALELDDIALNTPEVRGPATTVRHDVRELASGFHTGRVRWRVNGADFEHSWSFDVDAPSIPFDDDFDRVSLGDRWTPVDSLRWNTFDPAGSDAAGEAAIEGGVLRLASTGGAFGVVLRGIEAPEAFVATWTAVSERGITFVLRRNELARPFEIPPGSHEIEWRESPTGQQVFVDGRKAGAWTPLRDHRQGVFGLGIGAGQTVWIDDFRLRRSAPN